MTIASRIKTRAAVDNVTIAKTINSSFYHDLVTIEDMRFDFTPLKFYHFTDGSKLGYDYSSKQYFIAASSLA